MYITIRNNRVPAVVVLIWLAASSLFAVILASQERVYFPHALAYGLINYGYLALLALPVWKICHRLGENPPPRHVSVGIHLLMAAAVIALWQGTSLLTLRWLMGDVAFNRIWQTLLWQLMSAVLTYAVMTSVIMAYQASLRVQAQRRRQTELLLAAREAEIRAVRAQMRPHFFFNVLNSIYSLIEMRPRQAQEMVELVADLMRRTLESADEELAPLEWEVALIRTYLQIEKIRFGDRLRANVECDPSISQVPVPPFLLQPLVENAVKHGIAQSEHPVEIGVAVCRTSAGIEFIVRDTGPGCPSLPLTETDGRGLALTRRRLENLYPGQYVLSLRNLAPQGFEACVRIPEQNAARTNG